MIFYNVSWLIILLVSFVDSLFAIIHRDTFQEWELNPLARIIGVYFAVLFRIITVLFGYFVIKEAKEPLRSLATSVVLLIHAALLLVYIFS